MIKSSNTRPPIPKADKNQKQAFTSQKNIFTAKYTAAANANNMDSVIILFTSLRLYCISGTANNKSVKPQNSTLLSRVFCVIKYF